TTAGTEAASNSTVCLGPEDVPQPDGMLWILPRYGGQSRINKDGYVVGAPELAVEVAASTSSIDAHKKHESYQKYGVPGYLLWRTVHEAVDWWFLEGGTYKPLPVDEIGVIRSRIFPGLWLDRAALLQRNRAKLMECLQQGIQSVEHKAFVETLSRRKQ